MKVSAPVRPAAQRIVRDLSTDRVFLFNPMRGGRSIPREQLDGKLEMGP